MPGAMLGACATHMPDALHERTNELTNADLASKTEISGSVGNARGRLGRIYLVEWPSERIAKVGVTTGERWKTFVRRGAVLRHLHESLDALADEARLHEEIRSTGWPRAFACKADAAPFLGGGGAGWTECYRLGEDGNHRNELAQRRQRKSA